MTKEKQKERHAKYYLKNKEKIKSQVAEYRRTHKDDIKKRRKKRRREYYLVHKQEIKEYMIKYQAGHKDEIKAYRAEHKQERKAKSAKYHLEHREELMRKKAKYKNEHREQINEQVRNKRLTDPLTRLSSNLRSRTTTVFNRMKLNKPAKTEELLGADWKTVMQHIESKFTFGMDWSKVGSEIHIDHKIPLAKAKTEKQLIKLCHFTNLQPLWAEDNRRKHYKTDYTIKEVRFG
jgi:hypothetical protein